MRGKESRYVSIVALAVSRHGTHEDLIMIVRDAHDCIQFVSS